MNKQLAQRPLSDSELDYLELFLASVGAPTMSLAMLDGFFAALICGPEGVMPSEYLPQILGEEHTFDSHDQAAKILELIIRHWNAVASGLVRTLEKNTIYLPVLLGDEKGVTHGNEWAQGFMRGVQLRPESWYELITSEEFGGLMLPIMMLNFEHDPDLTLRSPEVKPEKREELVVFMIACLTRIYRYFEPQRRAVARAPVRKQRAKIGRNTPCPCGSGRKYKYCCAAG